MKFTSVKKKFESLGCPLLDFSVITTGDTKNYSHSHVKHQTTFLCLLIYSHLKCKFWFYQDTKCMNCVLIYLHKKRKRKTNEIRSRNLAVYCWLPCLPHYLSWKHLLRNVATLTRIGPRSIAFEEESDTVVFSKVWHHPYYRHVMV